MQVDSAPSTTYADPPCVRHRNELSDSHDPFCTGWPQDAHIYSMDPDALFGEFSRRGASFVKNLSFIEEGLWGFAITDADGYLLTFYQLRNK